MASKAVFEIEASLRRDVGKGASRRLRHNEKVPAVVYGGGKAATSLTLEHKKIAKALENEAFYSHILTLKTDSEAEKVILKAVQRHSFKARILHVDFQRIRADEKLQMHVPLHFTGQEDAPGLKEGGIFSHIASDVLVSCLPAHLPEYIAIDVSQMALNDILHLSDIKLPEHVELVDLLHGNDKGIVSLHIPRIQEEPEETAAPVSAEVPAMAQKSEGDAEGGKSEEKK
jgi:large subunit ribosomal protein L25